MALTDNIVAYWKFDEGSGTSAADATGNGNNGTLVNSPTWGPGKINDGLSFASNQYVNIGNNPALNFNGTMPFTIAGWGKTTIAQNAEIFDGLTGTNGFRLAIGAGSGSPNGSLTLYISGSWKHSLSTVFDNGSWHQFGVTYDGTTLSFYVDGSFDSSSTTSGPTSVSMNRSIGNIAGLSYPFGGTLDEIGIWSRALSAGEISTLYGGGAGLQYPFSTSTFNPAWARRSSLILGGSSL